MKYQIGEHADSLLLFTQSFEDMVRRLCEADLDSLTVAVEAENDRRNEQKQRKLAGAIVSAMDVYLQEIGDNRDFYSRGGECMSMQDMHDAIVNEFDLNAQ